jgi:glyoxylase-like metal-dependent hydrolase (beta-lactamase superfamily II)
MKLHDGLYAYPWQSMRENNCNSYLLDGPVRTLIDPGHLHLLANLEARMAEDGFSLEEIDLAIATHPHPDHCEGLLAFAARRAHTAMHEEGERFLREFSQTWQEMSGQRASAVEVDFFLRKGSLKLGDETLQVIESPGHAPGSICFYWVEQKALFAGDVVFSGAFGRTDLPGGDPLLLARSIQALMDLDVDWLLPGHGPVISGRGAVKENFYVISGLFQQLQQEF